VWRTDQTFVSAAFGQARILVSGNQPAPAVAVLDSVPASSSHHLTAQIAAARLRVGAGPASLAVADLVDAAARVERLRLDVERRAVLTVELLDAALAWLDGGGVGTADSLLGHRLNRRDVRFGLEAAYRALAKVAPDTEARIALVDRANRVRPRTWW
jgi:serine/threonine-protein kinase PknG